VLQLWLGFCCCHKTNNGSEKNFLRIKQFQNIFHNIMAASVSGNPEPKHKTKFPKRKNNAKQENY